MRRFLQDENQCYRMDSTEQEHLLSDYDIVYLPGVRRAQAPSSRRR